MKNYDLTGIFDNVKHLLMHQWKNAYLAQTYAQGLSLFDNILINNSFELNGLAELLQEYTYQQF